MGHGIDYGNGMTNVDFKTGIRYGVISQHDVLQAWADSSEAYYGKPDRVECPECGEEFGVGGGAAESSKDWGDTVVCENEECEHEFEIELPDCAEPISFFLDDGEYKAECGDSGDIFIALSPYYTRAAYCSPCAPGACHLANPCDDGDKAFCFDHSWFEDGKAPYTVYKVSDDSVVEPSK